MKSKTLSKMTWYVFILIVFSIAILSTDLGKYFPKELNWLIPGMVFVLFFLIASRVISYLGLSGHKGQKINALVFSYRYFYILLTDEARQEWRDFIAAERERINQKLK